MRVFLCALPPPRAAVRSVACWWESGWPGTRVWAPQCPAQHCEIDTTVGNKATETHQTRVDHTYQGRGGNPPLSLFMTSVPRIRARLVRPTPTWQLKRRAGSFRGSPLWPRDRLALSWRAKRKSVREEKTAVSTSLFFCLSLFLLGDMPLSYSAAVGNNSTPVWLKHL